MLNVLKIGEHSRMLKPGVGMWRKKNHNGSDASETKGPFDLIVEFFCLIFVKLGSSSQ